MQTQGLPGTLCSLSAVTVSPTVTNEIKNVYDVTRKVFSNLNFF